MENGSSEAGNDRSGIVFLLILACILGISLLPSIVLSALGFFIVRRFLNKIEAAIVLLASLVILFIVTIHHFLEYLKWVCSFAFKVNGFHPSAIPFLTILDLSCVFISSLILLSDSKFGSFIPSVGGGLFKRKIEPSEGVMPSQDEIEVIRKIASVPNSALTIEVNDQSIARNVLPGSRGFPIGLDKFGQPVSINENEIGTHGLIFGSTGSGKTELIKTIAGGLLDLGWSGMILDLKEDTKPGGLLDWCEEYSHTNTIPFQDFSLTDKEPKFWFSPLYGIGIDEAIDTILSAQSFDSGYYESLNRNQLGQLVTLLYYCHRLSPMQYPYPTVFRIGEILSASDLYKATKEMVAFVTTNVPNLTKENFNTLINPDKAYIETAAGLGARIVALYQTEVGRTSMRPGGGRNEFDVTLDGLTYVGLDSLGKGDLAKLLSSAVLSRMAIFAADRTSMNVGVSKNPVKKYRFLIVDEANFVDRKILLNLFSRARSADISIIACTQGPTDWNSRNPNEPGLSSILNNPNVVFVMKQNDQENAEIAADMIGRSARTDVTTRIDATGEETFAGSSRTVIDSIVSPEQIRALTVGQVVTRVGNPKQKVFWFAAQRRDPKLKVRLS